MTRKSQPGDLVLKGIQRFKKRIEQSRQELIGAGRGQEVQDADGRLLNAIEEAEAAGMSSNPLVAVVQGGLATFARLCLGLPPSPLLVHAIQQAGDDFRARREARRDLLALLHARASTGGVS